MAVGQMGLGLDDYLNLTPFEFNEAQKHFYERINADREFTETMAWQVARWQVWRTLCPPDKKGPVSVLDMIELPGDEAIKQKMKERESTPEKFEDAKKRFGDFKK